MINNDILSELKQLLSSYSAPHLIWNWAKGQFEESKVNRDKYGKFSSTGTSSGTGSGSSAPSTKGQEPQHQTQDKTFTPTPQTDAMKSLMKKEKHMQCLYLVAAGDRNSQISDKTKMGIPVIKLRLQDCIKALNAVNRTDAVVQGIKHGILDINKIDLKYNKYLQEENKGQKTALTEAEKNALIYAAAGLSQKETGQYRNKNLNTQKKHLSKVYKKFALEDKTSSVVHALKNGIITLDEIDEVRKKGLAKGKKKS